MINLLARLGYLKLVGKVVKDSVVYKNHVSFIETFLGKESGASQKRLTKHPNFLGPSSKTGWLDGFAKSARRGNLVRFPNLKSSISHDHSKHIPHY